MPFVKTAYLSDHGTARQSRGGGENIIHFNAIRMRLTGDGSLLMTMYGLDDANEQELVPFTMVAATNREPTRLANFQDQRAALKIETTEIDEFFKINRIIVFAKELWTSYPGTE